jgi:MoaA/NifB/PqqE/SkfB family radical SAM enzyme
MRMKRVEFHISYKCFNNCIFCSESDQLQRFKNKFVAKEEILKRLQKYCKRGFEHVSFTGGEPTLHPDFVEIIRTAKSLGYRTYVSSNGGLFYLKHFCDQVCPYLDEICFSLHGHNAKLHQTHTRNTESFTRLVKALENIENSSQNIYGLINIVVTKYNLAFLCEIVDFISKYRKIQHVLISNLAPEGKGLYNFDKIAVSLDNIRQRVSSLVKMTRRRKLILRFFGVPMCILKDYYNFSNDAHWSARVTFELWKDNSNYTFIKRTRSYKPVRKRVKLSECKLCVRRYICGGVFQTYLQKNRNIELIPFRV